MICRPLGGFPFARYPIPTIGNGGLFLNVPDGTNQTTGVRLHSFLVAGAHFSQVNAEHQVTNHSKPRDLPSEMRVVFGMLRSERKSE